MASDDFTSSIDELVMIGEWFSIHHTPAKHINALDQNMKGIK